MKNLKRISLFFGAALLLCGTLQSRADTLFDGEEKEVVYFFSYHCGACYESSTYVRAWSALFPNQRVRRVPVFSGEQWRSGARLFFLLELSKKKYPLTDFDREKAAYALVGQWEKPPVTATDYMDMLRAYGMKFSASEFASWWNASGVLMKDSEDILQVARLESQNMNVPFVRVSSEIETQPVYIDFSNPEAAVPALNGALK